VTDLMRGKINLFGLDALVNMASAAGLRIEMRAPSAGVARCRNRPPRTFARTVAESFLNTAARERLQVT
jgi:hypothetical protein